MLMAHVAIALHAGDTLTVTFTGDVLLDRGVRRAIEQNNGDTHFLFSSGIDSLFSTSDVVVANLECPATKVDAPVYKKFVFRGEPEWLATLKAHGVTHLNLANNHSIDQGREGLIDTRDNIIKEGMVPIGAGNNMEDAVQPVLISSSPRNVYVLASLRLALENTPYLPDHPSVTHQLIDAGADCLICHHTHTMQSVEQYHGKYIYYSIGNFIFDQKRDINARACAVSLKITEDTITPTTIPIYIHNCTPHIVRSDF